MHPNLLLNKIERKYSVETIIAEGLPVWEFLRNIYSDKLVVPHPEICKRYV